MRRLAIAACIILSLASSSAQAQLRGHGGPVRALAISPDGKTAISGSFDQTAIVWSLARQAAEQVLRFHDGAVNAAVLSHRRPGTAPSGSGRSPAAWAAGAAGAARRACSKAMRRTSMLSPSCRMGAW